MVRVHRPCFVALSKPFVPINSINRSFWRSLGLFPFATNDRGFQAPNLWVLCHEALQPTVLSSTFQQVTFSCMIDGLLCIFTVVYAKTSIVGRRALWNDLREIHSTYVHDPWVVLEDFNCVLGAHEKRGGSPPNLISCLEFQQMCTAYELMDIPTVGLAYTWSNRRTDVRLDRSLARRRLDAIQAELADLGPSEDRFLREDAAIAQYQLELSLQHTLLRDKSRVKWLIEGDRNTSFLHNMVKVRSLNKTISSLSDGQATLQDHDSIPAYIVQYYETMFTRDQAIIDSGLVERVIPQLITAEENVSLIAILRDKEISLAVNSMDSGSSPSPDGFGGGFFKACWSVVANDVILASAFIRSRSITDPIILTSECMNLLDHKSKFGNMAIKFDIAKAFDTVDWNFLLRVLLAFGFDRTFVNWVHCVLKSAHLSILVNGQSCGFFTCSRGVRQGDPLSPTLFCLAEEVLSRGLTGMANPEGLSALSQFMEEYGANSGQVVNRNKSLLFIGKHALHRQTVTQNLLGIKLGELPFTYLGVPIFQGRPKSDYLRPVADKIQCKLTAWKGKLLSQAARLQLIDYVIHSVLIYSFQIYSWPSSLLKEVQWWIRNFFWTGDPLKKGVALVSWDRVCQPKDKGGLGLKNLVVLNGALLLKKGWDVVSKASPLRWIIGDGASVRLWKDNWMGEILGKAFGLSSHELANLDNIVSEFIVHGKWVLPDIFGQVFPGIAAALTSTTLPLEPTKDQLVWSDSSSGTLTSKEAYLTLALPSPMVAWESLLWHSTIQPRKSICSWKIFHEKILTDE
ncbi:uncharacterized protein LOC112178246 [Rosa chinensis]|uniref:uncharacterized protein LOC112178246 n=1 Tax=Rosa chinensis TaxID=74649 RepID=UPI000D08BA8E|nr:uncharacterized protein LOC112178246 [Rosa chinensis]